MGADDSFTIDELAAAVGMTPRNVRAYRTKGLLPPPVRDGRASRYRTCTCIGCATCARYGKPGCR